MADPGPMVAAMRRADRDTSRLFAALVALVVVVFAAGAFGFLSLRSLVETNRDVLRRLDTAGKGTCSMAP